MPYARDMAVHPCAVTRSRWWKSRRSEGFTTVGPQRVHSVHGEFLGSELLHKGRKGRLENRAGGLEVDRDVPARSATTERAGDVALHPGVGRLMRRPGGSRPHGAGVPGGVDGDMKSKSNLRNAGTAGLMTGCIVLLGTCSARAEVGVSIGVGVVLPPPPPPVVVIVAPPPPVVVVVQDDYVYYPQYEVYFSSSRHQYFYREVSSGSCARRRRRFPSACCWPRRRFTWIFTMRRSPAPRGHRPKLSAELGSARPGRRRRVSRQGIRRPAAGPRPGPGPKLKDRSKTFRPLRVEVERDSPSASKRLCASRRVQGRPERAGDVALHSQPLNASAHCPLLPKRVTIEIRRDIAPARKRPRPGRPGYFLTGEA